MQTGDAMARVYDKLSKEQRTAFNYALTYPENEKRIHALEDSRRAIRYDADKVQTSGDSDPTFMIAVQIQRLKARNANIDDALLDVFGTYGDQTVKVAKMMLCYGLKMAEAESWFGRMAMNHNEYYRQRRNFWSVLSERI